MEAMASKEEKAQLRQIFIPLTAAEIIWDYVDKVLRYCADHKISETVKLSRAVKALRASYDAELDRHLDRRHRYLVRAACDDFKQNFSYDLTVVLHDRKRTKPQIRRPGYIIPGNESKRPG